MIDNYAVLCVLITFLFCSGRSLLVDFYPLINKTTNCPVKDSDVRLICRTNGTASRMIIKRARDQKPLYTSPQASTSGEFLIKRMDCVDMGVYQCIIDNKHTKTTLLVLPECPPLPCHQEGTNMSVYAEVNKPLDIALCVLVYSDILGHIDIDTVMVRRKAEVYFKWTWDYYENKQTDCSRNVTIELKHRNFTTEDYGRMSVRVYSSSGTKLYLDYNISLITPGQAVIVDFYPLIDNKTTNCPVKDSDVRLICRANGTASGMIIKRARDQKPLYTSPRASTSAQFLIKHVDCVDMGVYQCIIDNIHTETTLLVLPECPPLPCHQEGTNMSVYADVNKPLDITLCVWVYTGILNYTDIDTVKVRRKAEVNVTWTWDYYENKQTNCSRNVTIVLKHRNFTTEDYGGLRVRVYSASAFALYLDYNISLIPPDNKTQGDNKTQEEKKNQDKIEDPEDNEVHEDIITFLPPFLVIAGALVLTVVMIVRKEKKNKRPQTL